MANEKQLFIKDMSPHQIRSAERRMRPGHSSFAGFLGLRESLVTVIEADSRALERLGITHKQIGDRLESISGQFNTQYGITNIASDLRIREEGILIDGKFRVRAAIQRGIQVCPFAEEPDYFSRMKGKITDCGTGSGVYYVENTDIGESVSFAGLMVHLVRDHHFFQGHESQYRLDPETAVRVLEIRAGVDYTPKKVIRTSWNAGVHMSPEEIHDGSQANTGTLEWLREIVEIMQNADVTLDLTPEIQVRIKGNVGYLVAKEDVKLEKPLTIDGIEVYVRDGRLSRGFTKIYRMESSKIVG